MTYQVRENLRRGNQSRKIRACPLQGCDRPIPDFGVQTTGCYRGYEGTWEIQNDALHLVQVAAPRGYGRQDGLAEMFPEHAGSVEAIWFSGEIAPDDVVDPDDRSSVEWYTSNNRPLQFQWFTLVVHRGKLVLEETIDLQCGATQHRVTQHADGLFPAVELAFIRAIQANVDDAAPRLVYADWLEEQGDTRCEWVRAEVERLKKEGPQRVWLKAINDPQHSIPYAHVDPEDQFWFWKRLAGIPAETPYDRMVAREHLDRMKRST